jgi:subtilase family serine protease
MDHLLANRKPKITANTKNLLRLLSQKNNSKQVVKNHEQFYIQNQDKLDHLLENKISKVKSNNNKVKLVQLATQKKIDNYKKFLQKKDSELQIIQKQIEKSRQLSPAPVRPVAPSHNVNAPVFPVSPAPVTAPVTVSPAKNDDITFFYALATKKSVKPNTVSANPVIPQMCITGAQLKELYNIPSVPVTGRQVVIAIIIAYHNKTLQSDLNTYWKSPTNFGPLSTPPIIIQHNLSNKPNNVNSEWNMESCLDVQMVATMNPNAQIHVVEAKSSSNADMAYAVQYATTSLNADILSMSWGAPEASSFISKSALFVNPNDPTKHKCFCASSGDNNYVCWPSTLSNVCAVGGTTLLWNPLSSSSNLYGRVEYTWPEAGCGYSKLVTTPTYQNSVNSNKFRATPDVSLIANFNTGVYIVCNGKWNLIGGTSVSCPLFAGILSLANQQRFNSGKNPLTTVYTQTPVSNSPPESILPTNVQNYLYNNMNSNCFYDINVGTDGKYSAGKGYDIATGVGSPNATNLCNALADLN